MGTVTTLR